MVRIAIVAMLTACGAAARPPLPVPSRVQLAAPVCLAADTESRIAGVLAQHHADRSGLVVEVTARATDVGADVALRVVRGGGEVGLDRTFVLAANDCESAPQLIALAVDRWLTSFPEWAEPIVASVPPARWTELLVASAISAIASPLGVEGYAGGVIDHGARRDRFGGALLVRTGIPQTAGNGRFRVVGFLGGATWRHRAGAWESRIELRGGALRVNGIGFLENAASWLPWWEISAFIGRRLSFGSVGLEAAGTGYRAKATTRDGLVSEDIPLLRLGISAVFDVRAR